MGKKTFSIGNSNNNNKLFTTEYNIPKQPEAWE